MHKLMIASAACTFAALGATLGAGRVNAADLDDDYVTRERIIERRAPVVERERVIVRRHVEPEVIIDDDDDYREGPRYNVVYPYWGRPWHHRHWGRWHHRGW